MPGLGAWCATSCSTHCPLTSPNQLLSHLTQPLLSHVLQRRRAELEKQLAAAQADLKHMTAELLEAQVGAVLVVLAALWRLQIATAAREGRIWRDTCRPAAPSASFRAPSPCTRRPTLCCGSWKSGLLVPAPACPNQFQNHPAQEAADTLLRQLEDDLHLAARSVEESTRQVGPAAPCAGGCPEALFVALQSIVHAPWSSAAGVCQAALLRALARTTWQFGSSAAGQHLTSKPCPLPTLQEAAVLQQLEAVVLQQLEQATQVRLACCLDVLMGGACSCQSPCSVHLQRWHARHVWLGPTLCCRGRSRAPHRRWLPCTRRVWTTVMLCRQPLCTRTSRCGFTPAGRWGCFSVMHA